METCTIFGSFFLFWKKNKNNLNVKYYKTANYTYSLVKKTFLFLSFLYTKGNKKESIKCLKKNLAQVQFSSDANL